MKNKFIIFFLVVFASCEKPKTWECTCNYLNLPFINGSDVITIKNTKQTQAQKECDKHGEELAGLNGIYDCDIEVKR